MITREFHRVQVGDYCYASFSNSYRRVLVTGKMKSHLMIDGGLSGSGFPLNRRARYDSVDIVPRRRFIGWIPAEDDPDNPDRAYGVEAYDREGNKVFATGFVGSLPWAYRAVTRLRRDRKDAFAVIVVEHAVAEGIKVG